MSNAVWGGLAISLFGLYMLKHAISSFVQGQASLQWQTVKGRIIESNAIQFHHRGDESNMGAGYSLFVEYEYQVNNKKYKSDRDAFYTLNSDEALEWSQCHNENPNVLVYYNPNKPEEASLTVGPREGKKYSDIILVSMLLVVSISVTVGGYFGHLG